MPIVFDEIEATVVAESPPRESEAAAAEPGSAPESGPLTLQRELLRLAERAQRLAAD